jgi:hypothetical protein
MNRTQSIQDSEQPDDDMGMGDGEGEGETRDRVRLALSEMVDGLIREAVNGRIESGIEDVWEDAEDLFEGRDSLTIDARGNSNIAGKTTAAPRQATDGKSRILLNIIKPKTNSAVARVQEMLVPHDEKPWDLRPTPIPDLDQAIEDENETPVQLADGKSAPAMLVAQYLKDQATQAADNMATWIEDQFVEGPNDRKGSTVYAEMRKVIANAGKLGTGVLKGPMMISTKVRRWNIDKARGVAELMIATKDRPTSKNIDPRDLFPDPSCGEDIHAGSYIVERDRLTVRQLRDLARDEGYDREAIARCIAAGPTSIQHTMTGADVSRTQSLGVVQSAKRFEVFHYYGDISLDTLRVLKPDSALVATDLELALASVPCIVTMCNGEAIRVSVNPLESGAFPFDIFVWEPVAGQPWGRGVPTKGESAQRILTASVRRMLENAGMSAGPQIVKARNVTPSNNRNEITGRKLWDFTPDEIIDDVRKAFAIFNIPSLQKELMEILRMALEMIDQLTNLPLLMQGMVGAAPETLGGMQLLMANSTSPLRVIAKQFDDQLIYPHLTRYYDLGMQIAPEACKGDSSIIPKGSTTLVQREMAREILMQLYPVANDPELRINKGKLVAEMCKGHGFALSTIQYTEDEWKARQDEEAQKGGPPPDPALQVAQVRSQALIQAAQLKTQDAQQERQFKAQEAAQDRQAADALAQLQREIEMMKLAGHEHISLASVKAMLTTQLMKDKTTREVKAADYASRAAEMDLARETGSGV